MAWSSRATGISSSWNWSTAKRWLIRQRSLRDADRPTVLQGRHCAGRSCVYVRPRLSTDGQRLALEMPDAPGKRDVWIYEWQRDTMMRVTFGHGSSSGFLATWTPDGRYLVFQAPGGIFWTRADGAGKPQSLTRSKGEQHLQFPWFPWSFTPDGKRLAFMEGMGVSASCIAATEPVDLPAELLRRAATSRPRGREMIACQRARSNVETQILKSSNPQIRILKSLNPQILKF